MISCELKQSNLLLFLRAMPQKWVACCNIELAAVLSGWGGTSDQMVDKVAKLSRAISMGYVAENTRDGFVVPALVCAMFG